MRRHLSTYISLIVALLCFWSPAAAADPDRFFILTEGSDGATIKGGLGDAEVRNFYVEARKGQQLRAHLTTLEDNGYLMIFDDNGRSLLRDIPESVKVRRLDLVLPHSGDFLLQVASKDGDCSYMLEVRIDDPPPTKEDPNDRDEAHLLNSEPGASRSGRALRP